MQNLVTSLETSKRLKELGVEKESKFYWENQVSKDAPPSYRIVDYKAEYPAYLAGELAEMLPLSIDYKNKLYHFGLEWTDIDGARRYNLYYDTKTNGAEFSLWEENEEPIAGAMGLLLIHLLEKGIIKPETCK